LNLCTLNDETVGGFRNNSQSIANLIYSLFETWIGGPYFMPSGEGSFSVVSNSVF